MAYAASTVTKGDYGLLISTYDSIAREPKTYGEVVKKFGKGFWIQNFLHLAGQVRDFGSEKIKIIEEGAPERPVTVSIPTAIAGAESTITVASSDASDKYLRSGFDIVIPATYTNATVPKPMRVAYNGSAWKGYFYDPLVAITTALTTVEVIVGASSWGRGSGQPDGMASGFYERSTNARILKDTGGVEGGQIWQDDWQEVELANGSKGILSRLLTEMEFRLDSQKDSALFLGEKNDNNSLTYTSTASGAHKIPSFDGLVPTMKSLAQPLTYSTNFDMTKFEAVNALLEAVGVTNREIDFLVGTGLMTNVENAMNSWLNTNSPGTELYDMIRKYVGFNVRTIEKNGCTFNLVKLDSMSNPNKFGHANLPYKDWGFMFPKGEQKVTLSPSGQEQQTLKLPHLTLGYAVGKTENRRHWFNVHPGVNGIGHNVVANDLDGVKFYCGTHIIPVWTYMNQTILVTKS